MKRIINFLLAVTWVIMLSCSGPATPKDQLAEINELMGKGYPLTTEQKASVTSLIAEGKSLLEQGKQKESSEAFAKAIKVLELARDAYIFNKAD